MTDYLKTHQILTFNDVVSITPGNSNEVLVDVRSFDETIVSDYEKTDMLAYTGKALYVREAVAKKLACINQALRSRGMHLKVVYGYRHPKIQQRYFEDRIINTPSAAHLSKEQLHAYIHNFVAAPEIAGHPTGGAVDVTLLDEHQQTIDMGTAIADYSDTHKIRTYGPGLSAAQVINRARLHDSMISAGFAPFYGEWWHFSYGDREWAAFYNKKTALYGPLDFKT